MISGAALVVQRLAEGLAGRGHTVLVVAASDRGAAYTETQGTLTVARLQAWPNPFRKGQHFLAWPHGALAKILADFQPQVIHSHDPLVMSLAALGATQTLTPNPPLVLTIHQLPWFVSLFAPGFLRHPIEVGLWAYGRWLYRHCAVTVTPSQMIADLVVAHSGQYSAVISNGVDIERFRPQALAAEAGLRLRRKYGLDLHQAIVLYVGRLDIDKRVDLVLRAMRQVQDSVRAQLLVVGDGRQRESLLGLRSALGIGKVVSFTGFVSDDLPNLYRLANVFVTASQVEIQSSVVLEAAASGLPVVALRASSMPEYVKEGVTGFLVPVGSEGDIIGGLAARLGELVNNPGQATSLGQAGRALAEGHSTDKMIAAHEILYQNVLDQANPANHP
jgi:glycosyltransferase involved in cell wall biosynthesis